MVKKIRKGNRQSEFLKSRHYNGIVNFIHYEDVNTYKPVHKLLSENTEHLIFLSSYRVYADLEHPITENSPTLYETVKDGFFGGMRNMLSQSRKRNYLSEMKAVQKTTQ